MNVNYTWSHFFDDLDSAGWGAREGFQNYQNAFDPSANYSNSNFDIRNMFKGQAIYQLPFGRGKQFLNKNLLLNEVLGGWQVSGVWVIEDGNPMGITTGNNNSSNNQSGGTLRKRTWLETSICRAARSPASDSGTTWMPW